MINSRLISDLDDLTQPIVADFFLKALEQGIDLLATSTFRDFEQQTALHAIGRTVTGANPTLLRPMGDRVTNAKAGSSWHNWRCAVDVVPVVGGKTIWNDPVLWKKIGAIGEAAGLEWAGRWKGSLCESAHFQYADGKTLATLLQLHPKGL